MVLKMGHASYRGGKLSTVYFPTGHKSYRAERISDVYFPTIRVLHGSRKFGRESYGAIPLKSGFSGEAISGQTFFRNATSEPIRCGSRKRESWECYQRTESWHVVSGVVIFPTHPGSRINLLRAVGRLCARRRLSGRKNAFYLPARFFSNLVPVRAHVPDSWESELGFARYGSATRGRRSVFGPFEDSFPIEIPARPGKILAIREFHACILLFMGVETAWKRGSDFIEAHFKPYEKTLVRENQVSTQLPIIFRPTLMVSKGRKARRCLVSLLRNGIPSRFELFARSWVGRLQ
uniref:Uncharacterized protein n=1 Tax=Fagus sylvatica TaxID=28930 RepID=A0A2N9FFC3_FAGSY